MRLSELAFSCHIYTWMTDYDSSYQDFLKTTDYAPDLRIAEHRVALLGWLNKWGCRQFAREYHKLASEEIGHWYEQFDARLFPAHKTLLELSEDDVDVAKEAYQGLASRAASKRNTRSGSKSIITVGPTGAAKILFAIRPKALAPWDAPIREELELDGSAESYSDYLGTVRTTLGELAEACMRNGYNLSDLPKLLGRPDTSLVKLIDEYFWVTITRKCPAPSNKELAQWITWS